MSNDELVLRRRRREELLTQLAMHATWRDRLLARKNKYVRARQELAHRLSQM